MSGESSEIMHLTQLERESAGAYACGATNTEGETRSSSIALRVQCKYLFTHNMMLCECLFYIIFLSSCCYFTY